MLNKIIKLFGITLMGAMLFSSAPFTIYAYVPYATTNFYNVDNNINSQSFSAVTEPASFIENTSVQLNSLIYNEANNSSNAWFEWGTTTNLGNKTVATSVGNLLVVRHANIMTGLLPGTTYYFRAVAENSLWRNIGSILNFTTSGVKQNAKISATINTDSTNIITKTNTEANIPTNTEAKTNLMQSFLEANVFGAGFSPVNIFGWTLLIILILVLILLGKYLYGKFLNKE